VTCRVTGAPPDWALPFSSEPTVRCSWLATGAGSATGSGPPLRGAGGQVPAVSLAWAPIPSSEAGWTCTLVSLVTAGANAVAGVMVITGGS
jgi:hypothetical protein